MKPISSKRVQRVPRDIQNTPNVPLWVLFERNFSIHIYIYIGSFLKYSDPERDMARGFVRL